MEIKIKKEKKPKMKMLRRIFAHHPFLKGLQGANLKNKEVMVKCFLFL